MPENAAHYEYRVKEFWTGWFGGWGDSGKFEKGLNELAVSGWRVASTKTALCLWMWIVPRRKMLIVYERSV